MASSWRLRPLRRLSPAAGIAVLLGSRHIRETRSVSSVRAAPGPQTRRSTTMTDGIKTVVVPVSDLAASKAFYTRLLGTEPQHDAPYYVGFDVAGQHFGLNPHGDVSAGPVYFWHVPDLAATRDALVAAGATVVQDATPVGGSRTIATLTDPDGHTVGLAQDA